jgi:hypothetical protein
MKHFQKYSFLICLGLSILGFEAYHYGRAYLAARIILVEHYYLLDHERYAYAIQYRIELQQRYPANTILNKHIRNLEYYTFVKYLESGR